MALGLLFPWSMLDYGYILPLLGTLFSVCLCTRLYTGTRYSRALSQDAVDNKAAVIVPFWIPFLGSALSFAIDVEGTCTRSRETHKDGVVAFQIGITKYYLISMPGLITQVFSQKTSVLSKDTILSWFMKVAFDDHGTSMSESEAFESAHKVLNLMLRDKFVKDTTASTLALVEQRTSGLVSTWKVPEAEEYSLWERLGEAAGFDEHCVDVNLYSLVVNFVGDVVTRVLFGNAFSDNNPNLMDDLWIFDEGVHRLLNGAFAFTTKAKNARASRKRLLDAVNEWQIALSKCQNGQDPGHKWGKMNDVSETMALRVKSWDDNGASARLRSCNDFSVLWGANANSNKNIFWMLLQVYTRPELLAKIRDEISPFVKIAPPAPNLTRAQANRPKLKIDLEGLTKSCPLIKATFFETMRVNMSGIGVRYVKEDFTLRESTSDALLFGKDRPQSYNIPAGSMLALSNGSIQQDPRLFPEPEKFRPERFLFPDELDPKKVVARMTNLNTFGGGTYKCRGRYFAEKEVLIFVAAIVTLWDLDAVDGEKVRVPEMAIAGASRSPKADVRVRLRCRFEQTL